MKEQMTSGDHSPERLPRARLKPQRHHFPAGRCRSQAACWQILISAFTNAQSSGRFDSKAGPVVDA